MFLLILALLGSAGIFFFASATQYTGWPWSYELCRQSTILCDHPGWILIAAGAAILLEMFRVMTRA